MKTKFFLTLVSALAVFLFAGCKSLDKVPGFTDTPIETSENLVLRAEQVIASSHAVCDAFVMWEYVNREALPERVTQIADEIRGKKGLFINARSFLRAYKAGNLNNAKALMALIDELEILETIATQTLTESR